MRPRVLRYEVIFPGLVLAFVGILFFKCFGYPWRTAQLPMIIGGITIGLTLIEFCRRMLGAGKKEQGGSGEKEPASESSGAEDRHRGQKRLGVTLLGMLFFFLAVPIFGFTMTSLLLTIGLIQLLGYRRPLMNLIYSICLVGGMAALFVYFLGIDLPRGMILERFFG